MTDEGKDFADEITDLCLAFFDSDLSSKGKPRPGQEWTVFSAIVQENPDRSMRVVAAGTGSKCLGASEVSLEGDLLHDSHAEAIARRAFKRYLLSKIGGGSDVFEAADSEGLFRLRQDVRFHFFSTHPPCGDATISVVEKVEQDDVSPKRPRLDLQRTGAKCLPGDLQDDRGDGLDFHTSLGAIRTKPGRGDPTRSLSCSDKLLKWGHLGLQGSILASVTSGPVRIASVTVCGERVDLGSMRRALLDRFSSDAIPSAGFDIHHCGGRSFRFCQREGLPASPCSIIYCRFEEKTQQQEVSVDGRRQGCVRKNFGSERARVKICRRSLAEEFVSKLLGAKNDNRSTTLPKPVLQQLSPSSGTPLLYEDLKHLSPWYEEARLRFCQAIPSWPVRSDATDKFRIASVMDSPKIYLFKAAAEEEKEDDDYVIALREAGYHAEVVPVIQFEYKTDELLETLLRHECGCRYSGIVFTSPRSVLAFASAVSGRGDILDSWKDRYAFCVGEKTSRLVRENLGLEPEGDEAGSGSNLADYVVEKWRRNNEKNEKRDNNKLLLFPTGNLTDDYLEKKLEKDDFTVDKIVVYHTTSHEKLEENVKNISVDSPAVLVFFSPSGVKSVNDAMKSRESNKFFNVALGETTKKAIIEAGWRVNAVCAKPNAHSLVEAVRIIIKQ